MESLRITIILFLPRKRRWKRRVKTTVMGRARIMFTSAHTMLSFLVEEGIMIISIMLKVIKAVKENSKKLRIIFQYIFFSMCSHFYFCKKENKFKTNWANPRQAKLSLALSSPGEGGS